MKASTLASVSDMLSTCNLPAVNDDDEDAMLDDACSCFCTNSGTNVS